MTSSRHGRRNKPLPRVLEAEVEKIVGALIAAIYRPETARALLAAQARARSEATTDQASILETPEFDQLRKLVGADEVVGRVYTPGALDAMLSVLVGAKDVNPYSIRFREPVSLEGEFVRVLATDEDVAAMRAALGRGQVWIRRDLIPVDQMPLALAWADMRREEKGLPPRRIGRPRGRTGKWARVERWIDPSLADEEIWLLLVKAGLTEGEFVDRDPVVAESNAELVAKVRRNARRARRLRARP